MIDRRISMRYAKALNKICDDSNIKLSDALTHLSYFDKIMKENPKIPEFLKMSTIQAERKAKLVDELFSRKGDFYIKQFVNKDIADRLASHAQDMLKEFVKYIVAKNRLALFSEILEIFEELVNERENKLKSTVKSAIELDNTTKDELKKHLEKKFNKTIDFTFSVDESLMAGIIVKIGDVVYDGSMNTYLNNLERKLLRLPL